MYAGFLSHALSASSAFVSTSDFLRMPQTLFGLRQQQCQPKYLRGGAKLPTLRAAISPVPNHEPCEPRVRCLSILKLFPCQVSQLLLTVCPGVDGPSVTCLLCLQDSTHPDQSTVLVILSPRLLSSLSPPTSSPASCTSTPIATMGLCMAL